MLFSVEQAFVGRDEIQAPLKTPAWEASGMDECLRVLKGSIGRRFDSYSVKNSVLIISHVTFRDCRVHIFSDNLSRNSCIQWFLGRVYMEVGETR